MPLWASYIEKRTARMKFRHEDGRQAWLMAEADGGGWSTFNVCGLTNFWQQVLGRVSLSDLCHLAASLWPIKRAVKNFHRIGALVFHHDRWSLTYKNTVCKKNFQDTQDLLRLESVEGQLISQAHFVFFNSPKNWPKNFCPSRLVQKFEFSSSFFGRIGYRIGIKSQRPENWNF